MKKPQIAHISRDASDSSYENLAVLCLAHHDEYDSRPSQSKGFTPDELRHYKLRLIDLMSKWENGPHQVVVPLPLASDLRPSAQPEFCNISAFPLVSLYGLALDPTALQVNLNDSALKDKTVEMLRGYECLSSNIKTVGRIDAIAPNNLEGSLKRIFLIISDEIEWNYSVLIFTLYDDRWYLTASIPVGHQKGNKPSISFISGQKEDLFSIQYLAGSGTGVLLHSATWYSLAARGIRPIFTLPIKGYVVGWGLPFQRHIASDISLPSSIIHGARLDIRLIVDYRADPSFEKYEEMDLMTVVKRLVLIWDEQASFFIPGDESTMSFKDAEGFFGDDCNGFIERYSDEVIGMARLGGQMRKEWVLDLLKQCKETETTKKIRGAVV